MGIGVVWKALNVQEDANVLLIFLLFVEITAALKVIPALKANAKPHLRSNLGIHLDPDASVQVLALHVAPARAMEYVTTFKIQM